MHLPQPTETPGYAHELPDSGERQRSVAEARVGDVCSKGILSCSSFATVAEMGHQMAAHRIHSLIVWQAGGARWGAVTDVDVAFAALTRPDAVADDLAEPAPAIADDASLRSAVTLMHDQRTSHLVVIDGASERPTGILSALDIAGVAGWTRD
jgi:CBS domain-containing protein